MSKTIRHKKDYVYEDRDSQKKSKDKKFFGYPEDNWARLHGKDGKKSVYR